MANKLTKLRFDQAANLVDEPANVHAKITLFKRRTPPKWKPDLAVEAKFQMPTSEQKPAPEALPTVKAEDRHDASTNRNEDNMTEMNKRQAWENVIQAEADLIQEVTDCTPEQAYAKALLKRPDAVRKMYGHADPNPQVTKADDSREKTWIEIEGAADRIVQKSRYTVSREQALDRVMKARPDLMRKYYGVDPTAQ